MDIQNNQTQFLNITTKLKVNYDELKATINQNEKINENENDVYFKLTPASLLEYGENKEQYVIIDTSNKFYVRPEDADNYISSKNLMEFLGKYGIVDYQQLEEIYNTLYSNDTQSIAMSIEDIQKNMPNINSQKYWKEETEETVGKQIYTNMLEKVSATLNNISQVYCSCGFNVIADMLAYTDVANVTEQEIYKAFKDYSGLEYGSTDYIIEQLNNKYNIKNSETQDDSPTIKNSNDTVTNYSINNYNDNNDLNENQDITTVETTEDTVESKAPEKGDIKNTDINLVKNQPVIVQSRITAPISVKSSTGKNFNIPVQKVSFDFKNITSTFNKRFNFNIDRNYINSQKRNIDNLVSMARNELYASERVEELNSDINVSDEIVNLSSLSLEAKRLFSNYIIDGNGNYVLSPEGERQLKTLRQKIIDVYHIAQNYNELGIGQGEIKDNKGDKQNKETDLTVRGAIKSVEKDIQKSLGVEGFDYDAYMSDYADYADKYAKYREEYDSQYKILQESQVPDNLSKASWYTNLWISMGGEDKKLGEDVSMNIVTNNVKHGHHHGSYSNEISCEINIPENTSNKGKDNFITLSKDQLNSEEWLKAQMQNKNLSIEKYNNKKAVNDKLSKAIDISENTSVKEHPRYTDKSMAKELESMKNLMGNRNKFNDFM